jgi:hypothetical protein
VRHKLAEWDIAAGGTGKGYSMRKQKSGSTGLKYKVCVLFYVLCTQLFLVKRTVHAAISKYEVHYCDS